jgi:hypothetical protein
MDLGAVDGQHLDADQASLRAQAQDLAEQLGQRTLVALAKPRDGRVIRRPVGAHHAHGDVLDAASLDPPRRPLADRVAVQQQRHHHRRLVRRPAVAVLAIGRIERRQIHRLDGVDDKPRQMALGQPLPQRRRQQQLLVPIAAKKVLRHPEMVLTPPDDTRFTQQPPRKATVGFARMRACERSSATRMLGTIRGSADRSRAGACYALAEQA